MKVEKEADIQKAILDFLRLKRYVVTKHYSTVFKGSRDTGYYPVPIGDKGVSDIIGCSPTGRFIAVEVKKPGGSASDDQIAYLENIRAAGGIGFTAWSLDDALDALARDGDVPLLRTRGRTNRPYAL